MNTTSITNFGAVGDGVTDDTAALQAALVFTLAHLVCLYIPSGTYKIIPDNLPTVVLQSNFCMRGDGVSSILDFHPTENTTFKILWKLMGTNIWLSDFKINWVGVDNPSGGPILFETGVSHNVVMNNLEVDMGVSQKEGTRNYFSAIWLAHTGNATHWTITNNRFYNIDYGFLKANWGTGIQKHWLFSNNHFERCNNGALSFNTPNGVMENIRVVGNTFKDQLRKRHIGGVAGGAHARGFYFSHNTFSGMGTGLHFEEGAQEVIISSNWFSMEVNAMEFLDNAVSGTQRYPTLYVVTNNIINGGHKERQSNTRGIWIIWDSSGMAGGADFVISGNVIKGVERCLSFGQELNERLVVTSNYCSECYYCVFSGGRIPRGVRNNVCHKCSKEAFYRWGPLSEFRIHNIVTA